MIINVKILLPLLDFPTISETKKSGYLSNFLINNLWKEFEAYQIAQWKKLQDIIYYASQTEVCREKLILRYFGEKPIEDCGVCDICLNSKQDDFDPKWILDYVSDSPKSIQHILLYFSKFSKEVVLEQIQILSDEEKIASSNLDFIQKIE